MRIDHKPALLSVTAAGKHLGHDGKSNGKTSVYRYIKEGKLTQVRLYGRTFVTMESAEKLVQELKDASQDVTE